MTELVAVEGDRLFLDQIWREADIHLLDEQKYYDWIYNAPKNSKPWLIFGGISPLWDYQGLQPLDEALRRALCYKKAYGDILNVGWFDYQGHEMIKHSLNFKSNHYGDMAPQMMYIKDGYVYHPIENASSEIMYQIMYKPREYADFIEPTPAPRTELSIYMEYAMQDLANSKFYADSFNRITDLVEWLDMEPLTDFHRNVIDVHLGKEARMKVRARKFVMFILLPLTYITVTILLAIKDCIFAKQ